MVEEQNMPGSHVADMAALYLAQLHSQGYAPEDIPSLEEVEKLMRLVEAQIDAAMDERVRDTKKDPHKVYLLLDASLEEALSISSMLGYCMSLSTQAICETKEEEDQYSLTFSGSTKSGRPPIVMLQGPEMDKVLLQAQALFREGVRLDAAQDGQLGAYMHHQVAATDIPDLSTQSMQPDYALLMTFCIEYLQAGARPEVKKMLPEELYRQVKQTLGSYTEMTAHLSANPEETERTSYPCPLSRSFHPVVMGVLDFLHDYMLSSDHRNALAAEDIALLKGVEVTSEDVTIACPDTARREAVVIRSTDMPRYFTLMHATLEQERAKDAAIGGGVPEAAILGSMRERGKEAGDLGMDNLPEEFLPPR